MVLCWSNKVKKINEILQDNEVYCSAVSNTWEWREQNNGTKVKGRWLRYKAVDWYKWLYCVLSFVHSSKGINLVISWLQPLQLWGPSIFAFLSSDRHPYNYKKGLANIFSVWVCDEHTSAYGLRGTIPCYPPFQQLICSFANQKPSWLLCHERDLVDFHLMKNKIKILLRMLTERDGSF
jgi:hypothetical protein